MTQIIEAHGKKSHNYAPDTIEPAPAPFVPHSIAWEEFGFADETDPTYDRDEAFDQVAYQQWLEAGPLEDNDEDVPCEDYGLR